MRINIYPNDDEVKVTIENVQRPFDRKCDIVK